MAHADARNQTSIACRQTIWNTDARHRVSSMLRCCYPTCARVRIHLLIYSQLQNQPASPACTPWRMLLEWHNPVDVFGARLVDESVVATACTLTPCLSAGSWSVCLKFELSSSRIPPSHTVVLLKAPVSVCAYTHCQYGSLVGPCRAAHAEAKINFKRTPAWHRFGFRKPIPCSTQNLSHMCLPWLSAPHSLKLCKTIPRSVRILQHRSCACNVSFSCQSSTQAECCATAWHELGCVILPAAERGDSDHKLGVRICHSASSYSVAIPKADASSALWCSPDSSRQTSLVPSGKLSGLEASKLPAGTELVDRQRMLALLPST